MPAIIPIFWRYLLGQYTKYFVYCVTTFLAVLITTRLDEIAHFATMGPEGKLIFWYVLYQIPYILPIAIPLSCLISSIILMRSLSQSHELTALRASGLPIRYIIAPLLGMSLFISMANFYITSELATHSHLSTNLLKKELRSINPLLLLHNKYLMRIKGFYFDTLGPSKMGESASDIVLATPNKDDSRINLLLANRLVTTPQKFYGKNVTIISSINGTEDKVQDRLIIENISDTMTPIQDFAKTVEKKVWKLHNDHLRLPLLLAKLEQERAEYNRSQLEGKPLPDLKQHVRCLNSCFSEILKRISVGLAPLTFTLLGTAFGMSIGRNKSNRGTLYVTLLAALFLVGFFAAKNSHHLLLNATLYYFSPHILIITASLWKISTVSKGVE